jgi:hypothetical protein
MYTRRQVEWDTPRIEGLVQVLLQYPCWGLSSASMRDEIDDQQQYNGSREG